ncbi:hypothetical protein B0O80DRAFT_504400 [Mortierella sp. GBAus27b]|nr:hypothetical protein B0O80DRAFT_504400 [Mortierella sp. GBAus27b]
MMSMEEFMDAHVNHESTRNNMPVAPFFFPKSNPSGPDLVFFIRIDGARLVHVVVQMKLHQGSSNFSEKDWNDALSTVSAPKIEDHAKTFRKTLKGPSGVQQVVINVSDDNFGDIFSQEHVEFIDRFKNARKCSADDGDSNDETFSKKQRSKAFAKMTAPIRREAAEALNEYRVRLGKKRRTFDAIRARMSRLFNREQEAQGTPVMPGPFDTDDAQRAVTASMESIKKEMDIITGKRQYQDNYEKVLEKKRKIADSSQKEQLTKLSEYETCFALSGIINARMKDADSHFDEETLSTIKAQCIKDDFCDPTNVPGWRRILEDLKILYTFVETDEVDYEGLANQATLLKAEDIKENGLKPLTPVRTAALVRRAVLDMISHLAQVRPDSTMYENTIASTWGAETGPVTIQQLLDRWRGSRNLGIAQQGRRHVWIRTVQDLKRAKTGGTGLGMIVCKLSLNQEHVPVVLIVRQAAADSRDVWDATETSMAKEYLKGNIDKGQLQRQINDYREKNNKQERTPNAIALKVARLKKRATGSSVILTVPFETDEAEDAIDEAAEAIQKELKTLRTKRKLFIQQEMVKKLKLQYMDTREAKLLRALKELVESRNALKVSRTLPRTLAMLAGRREANYQHCGHSCNGSIEWRYGYKTHHNDVLEVGLPEYV